MPMSSCGISVQQNTPCVGRQWEGMKDSEGAEFIAVEKKKSTSCLRGGRGACVLTCQTPALRLIPLCFPGKRLAMLVGEEGRVLIPEY